MHQSKSKSKNAPEDSPTNTYKFYLGSRERYLIISSNFESGNIQLVRQLSQFNYRLNCVDDGVKSKHRVNSKSWFYFAVKGVTKNTRVKFTVSRVQTLMANNAAKSYRPVCRDKTSSNAEWGPWKRIATESPLVMRQTGQLEVIFQHLFRNEEQQSQFAFTYPYTYSQNIAYLNTLNEHYSNDQFYFHKQILTYSPQSRLLHLLTITSHDHAIKEQHQELFDQQLFPQKCRPLKFKKPVILISARVHPGQTAASYAMEGVIDFLVNSKDARSYLLKKMFVFMVVPMINVDGVYNGHFRMDSFGKNLNRYYIDPSPEKQPAVFGIRKLADHLIKQNRLSFYFDLHAHNAKKGHFIYGNAINDFVEQVESQVFCKLFSLNDKGFEYEFCNFSQKQMNSKDRNEERTKEGCGRVVMHRLANIIHSYSLECGIISPTKQNIVPRPMNEQFQLGQRGLDERKVEEGAFFTQQSYRDLGKAMLVSVLDVFDKNPYNRVYSSTHKSMEFLRRVTAFQVFHHAQRFRMFEKYVYGKVKNINELIRQVLNSKLHYRELYNFYFYNDDELRNTKWPENIPGLVKPKFTKRLRRFKSMQEPKLEYSLSFLKDLKTNREELQQSIVLNGTVERMESKGIEELQVGSKSSQTDNQDRQNQIEQINQSVYYKEMLESSMEMHSEVFIPHEKQTLPEQDDEISRWNTNDMLREPWFTSKQLSIEGKNKLEGDEDPQYQMGLSVDLHSQIDSPTISNLSNLQNMNHVPNLNLYGRQSEYVDLKVSNNDSPSMRVRRLIKNESPKKTSKANPDVRVKLNEMIANSPQIINNCFVASNTLNSYNGLSKGEKEKEKEEKYKNPDNIYHDRQLRLFQQIKLEIRQELKKHKSGRGQSGIKGQGKLRLMADSKERGRIKSTNINFCSNSSVQAPKPKSQFISISPSKSSIGKTQLPALNSHMLVISSNSSKGLVTN